MMRPCLASRLRLALCLAASAPLAAAQVDYSALTDRPAEVPLFLPQPFTGLTTDSHGVLYAVNPMGNTVLAALGDVGATPRTISTGLNPVSIAIVEDRPLPGDRKLLVVCRGTHGMFVHDAVTGELQGYHQLESEPADVVYDAELQRAFVTCQGTNAILQFDPLSQADARVRYELPVGERPGYLYLDPGADGAADDRVYVAAAVTGNNTITVDLPGADPNFAVVQSLDGHGGGELDDFDVYVIDPLGQAMTAAVQGCGSLLFDLERFPGSTGAPLWILATDSLNGDPSLPDEPALNGRFAFNTLLRVPGVTGGTLQVAGDAIDLDDFRRIAGAQYKTERSINQARALDFANGKGYVASPFSDLVLELAANGLRRRELKLPAGAQCFDIEPIGNTLYALCLGTMTIESFDISPPASPAPRAPFQAHPTAVVGGGGGGGPLQPLPNPLPLGHDPTPEGLRRGRDVWFDGKLSANGRFSCASCHEGGMSDQLGWQISDLPSDVKDVMVTQSLLSIADTYPHHWRGERDLKDFQGAFAGLLGAVDEAPFGTGRDITDAEMADLNRFIRALQAPANPYQALDRRVHDDAGGGPSDDGEYPPTPLDPLALATQGKLDYETVPVPQDAEATCADCHGLETGSDGNLFPVNQGQIPRGFSTETPHFRQLQNKGRFGKLVLFDEDDDGTFETERLVPNNGFGFGHEGTQVSLRDFVDGFEATVDPLTVAHIFRFIDQFDQGIAPAAHWATWYDEHSPARVPQSIANLLLGGSANGWLDVAVLGRVRHMTTTFREMRWWFDPTGQVFVPEDDTLPAWDWTEMMAEVTAGDVAGVFLGLPPGAGERFAVDHDGDGHLNAQDPAPFEPDSSVDDGQLPALASVRVDFVTARLAKLQLGFSEAARYTLEYRSDPGNGNPQGPLHTVEQPDYVRFDTVVLPHNEPSTPAILMLPVDRPDFYATITLTDRQGNSSAPLPLEADGAVPGDPLFVPDPYFPESVNGPGIVVGLGLQHVARLAEAGSSPVLGTGGAVTFHVEVGVRSNVGAPNFEPPGLPSIFPPGTFDDEAVFVTVSHDASGTFEKVSLGTGVGQLTTPHATSIELLDETGAVVPYTLAPEPPWVVSPFLDVDGDTTLEFTLHGLPSGTTVRVAVMGILDEDPDASAAHGSTVFDRGSLQRYQALNTDLSQANGTHLDLEVP